MGLKRSFGATEQEIVREFRARGSGSGLKAQRRKLPRRLDKEESWDE